MSGRLVVAALGVVPALVSAYYGYFSILATSTLATSTAVANATITNASSELTNGVAAADAIMGVSITIVCGILLKVYRSIIGMLRLLWLVALVTSSCTYVTFRTVASNAKFVPNDVTIVAIGISIILFVITYILDRFYFRDSPPTRDIRTIAIEMVFACGACALRFDDDVQSMVPEFDGRAVWYASCWVASLGTIYTCRNPRTGGDVQDERYVDTHRI